MDRKTEVVAHECIINKYWKCNAVNIIQLCSAFLFRKSSLNKQQKTTRRNFRKDLSGKVGVLKEKLKGNFEVKTNKHGCYFITFCDVHYYRINNSMD